MRSAWVEPMWLTHAVWTVACAPPITSGRTQQPLPARRQPPLWYTPSVNRNHHSDDAQSHDSSVHWLFPFAVAETHVTRNNSRSEQQISVCLPPTERVRVGAYTRLRGQCVTAYVPFYAWVAAFHTYGQSGAESRWRMSGHSDECHEE